eukprot:CAMPEP_0170340202 /NCGR_PEP_ID=MMETSP0116_2-20130129/71197_1 /TAXON_ID=400756 /ORGANISM="Durinskia baltica, Strain CSIRO CS-38" /LENGTH=91 /DNA_ID=CAMNT_0010593697 /DNA_START=9 /DNA_END=281 /DNA_ORIENTATION=-
MSKVLPVGDTENPKRNLLADWESIKEGHKKFFGGISIAEDGGWRDVKKLLTRDRFFWAGLSIVFLTLNLSTIIHPNVQALLETEDAVVEAD